MNSSLSQFLKNFIPDQDQIEDRVIEISVDEDDLDEVTEKTVEMAKKRSVLDLLLGFFA